MSIMAEEVVTSQGKSAQASSICLPTAAPLAASSLRVM